MKRISYIFLAIMLVFLSGCSLKIKDKGNENKVELDTVSVSKNMLVYPYSETTKVMNGVTFTDNGDGSITLDGKAEKNVNFYFVSVNSNYTKSRNYFTGYYMMTGAIKDKCHLIACYRQDGTNINDNKSDKGDGVFFMIDTNSDKYNELTFEMWIPADTEFHNETVYPSLNMVYTESLEWKPYTK